MPSPSPALFSTLLLAGGRSQRMGGDKARLLWQGRPLWEVQLEKLLQLDPCRCLVACREEQYLHVEPADPEVEWLFDPEKDEDGPLGAIARALYSASGPLVVLAVDMPFMTADFLRERLELSRERGCFFATSRSTEPMAGCYAPPMLPVMQRRLARGERSLNGMIHECVELGLAQVQTLSAEEESLFTNANTPGEWQDCQVFKHGLA